MTEHTQEPWRAGRTTEHQIVFRAETVDGQPYLGKLLGDWDEANARRLVACVNALKGVPTEYLESLKPGDLHALYLALTDDEERTKRVTSKAGIIAELLATCQECLDYFDDEFAGPDNEHSKSLRAVIARATRQ